MKRLIVPLTVLLAFAPAAFAAERSQDPRTKQARKEAHKEAKASEKPFRELAIERNRRECAQLPLTRAECEKLVQAEELYEWDEG